MKGELSIYADIVREGLDRGVQDSDEFAAVAIAGERLRRALPLEDDLSDDEARALEAYDLFLARYPGEVPDIEAAAKLTSEALDTYARQSPLRRDPLDADRLLGELDAISCLAVAARRTGSLDDVALDRVSERMRDAVAALATATTELWQPAADRQLLYTPDPDYPQTSDWLDELARFASSRVELELALREDAHYRAIRRELVARARAQQGLAAVIAAAGIARLRARGSRAFYADDDQSLPDLERVFDFGELGVLRGDDYFLVWARPGHRVEVVAARAEGTELATDAEADDTVRVQLPPSWRRISLCVRFDGDELELPAIEWVSETP